MGIEITPPAAGVTLPPQASLTAFASITAPGAGGALGTVVAPPAGTYKARVYVSLTGTLTAAEVNNVKLLANGATVAILAIAGAAAAGQVQPPFELDFTANGVNNVVVQAIAGGGVAAVYSVTLILTRTG